MGLITDFGILRSDVLLKSFKNNGEESNIFGLDLAQPIFSNNVIMIIEENTSTHTKKVVAVDDIPKEDVCEKLGKFIPIIQAADKNKIITMTSFRTCDVFDINSDLPGLKIDYNFDTGYAKFWSTDGETSIYVTTKINEDFYEKMMEALDEDNTCFIVSSTNAICDESSKSVHMNNATVYLC